jgi:hypothetical protein
MQELQAVKSGIAGRQALQACSLCRQEGRQANIALISDRQELQAVRQAFQLFQAGRWALHAGRQALQAGTQAGMRYWQLLLAWE